MKNNYDYLLSRKGSTRTSDIPTDVLEALNSGAISTVNLTEWLMVDNLKLLNVVLKAEKQLALFKPVSEAVSAIKKPTVNSVQYAIGTTLRAAAGNDGEKIYALLTSHSSDSVRCWAAYYTGTDGSKTLEQKLKRIESLAADPHFGVREVAWLAVRPSLAAEL
ncbi:MAG: DNA alkylation repair protein, partial [Bacteroidia bacterium]